MRIRASYWSCRIGNEPQDFHLSPHEVESKAIASFGSKELIDPHKGRKVCQQIENQCRQTPFKADDTPAITRQASLFLRHGGQRRAVIICQTNQGNMVGWPRGLQPHEGHVISHGKESVSHGQQGS